MANFSYSDDKVERISSYRIIEEGGFYVGAITEAYDDASKSGARCIRFTFQSLEGRANFAIYYQSGNGERLIGADMICLLYTSPSPRDRQKSRMPSSA